MKIQTKQCLKSNIFIIAFLMLFSATACSGQKETPTSQKFWSEFRLAVLNNDNQKLINMTHFPLDVHGVDDSQPVVRYEKEQFVAIFNKIPGQAVISMKGDEIITGTTKDTIDSITTITSEHYLTKNTFRVDQLVFELKNKQWMLVRVYLEE